MSDNSDSDDYSDDDILPKTLTLAEARATLHQMVTCIVGEHRRQIEMARSKAQGDPRATMLSVIPMVVSTIAPPLAALGGYDDKGAKESQGRVLCRFLNDIKCLVALDNTGQMKKDLGVLRGFLMPS